MSLAYTSPYVTDEKAEAHGAPENNFKMGIRLEYIFLHKKIYANVQKTHEKML